MSTSKEKDQFEIKSPRNKINLSNKFKSPSSLKNEKPDEDFINYSNELLSENVQISPMINPIPCFTVKNESSTKEEISSLNTFYSNNNKKLNINISYNSSNDKKKEKTIILNKNFKNLHLNNLIMNNRYFRQYSPNLELKKDQINTYNNKQMNNSNSSNNTSDNNKINYEIYINNKKKFINKINKRKRINPKNILTGIKKNKLLNHLYFSTDNFYEKSNIDEKMEKIKQQKEQKRIKIKLLSQKINVATMKIEILLNYKKNKNINTIKKKIEYNKIYCNNDLKRIKDNYYLDINNHKNQIKYMKIKLLKFQENYIHINTHREEFKKQELNFKIKKMELIEKILFLKKKLNDKLNPDLIKHEVYNMDDSFEEKTINDLSFNDFSIYKDNLGIGNNMNKKVNNKIYKKNNNTFIESKIIKMNKHQINFFKAKFIKNVTEGK